MINVKKLLLARSLIESRNRTRPGLSPASVVLNATVQHLLNTFELVSSIERLSERDGMSFSSYTLRK